MGITKRHKVVIVGGGSVGVPTKAPGVEDAAHAFDLETDAVLMLKGRV